jgi:putative spermidine/putrescine transport system substrate-binding protein
MTGSERRLPSVDRRMALLFIASILVAACAPSGGTGPPTTAATPTLATDGGAASPSPGAASTSVAVEGGTGQYFDCLRSQYFDPFQAETDMQVISAPETDDTRIRLMVETGSYDVDVEQTTSDTVVRFGDELFERIDYSQINRDEIIEGLALDHGVGFDPFTFVVAYNTDFTNGQEPTTIEDFFDLERFPGKRGFQINSPISLATVALMADGVPPEEIIPIDFDRAYAKLDSIKDQLVFFETGSNSKDLLDSGETPLIYTFANRVKESLDGGQPVGAVWDGMQIQSDFLSIPKGNPNKDAAMRLIAYIMSKEVNGKLSDCIALAPGNRLSPVSDKTKDFLGTSHLDERHIVFDVPETVSWAAENQEAIMEQYQEWLGS